MAYTPPVQELPRASFDGAEFPWRSIRVKSTLRDHVHEYPHRPGGKPEKLGRSLYEIEVAAFFQTKLLKWQGEDLWPTRVDILRRKFEQEDSGQLVIPHIGRTRAYIRSWDQMLDATKVQNGEEVQLIFLEDPEEERFEIGDLVAIKVEGLEALGTKWAAVIEELPAPPSIFTQIDRMVNSVLAVRDQVQLYGNLVEAKILRLITICQEADETVDLLNDPQYLHILEALKDLWNAAVDLSSNLDRKAGTLQTWTVPAPMSIQEVAQRLLGDGSQGFALLALNAHITNAYEIPAGTQVRYYEEGFLAENARL